MRNESIFKGKKDMPQMVAASFGSMEEEMVWIAINVDAVANEETSAMAEP